MDLVSIVIPCFNPDDFLLRTIASARAQENVRVEIILVNDGSAAPESRRILEAAVPRVDRYIEQPNRGVSAARNAGMRAASGRFLLPLDSQDILKPQFASACLAALAGKGSEVAFAFADYRVFGERNYVERLPDYNLYDLLENNTLPYAALIRTGAWQSAGGYDESFAAHEDWEFWLGLAERGQYGHHLDRVLWAYRKQDNGLSALGRMHHAQLVARIRAKHPALYSPAAFARIKTCWRPSVCVVGRQPGIEPTICDWEVADHRSREELLSSSSAEVFLFPGDAGSSPEQLELAALASLDGKRAARLPHGSVAVPRAVLKRSAALDPMLRGAARRPRLRAPLSSGFFQTLWRHADNAEMLSADAWRAHPLQVLSRLIPLRWKERINTVVKRRVFDLSFYLRFHPESLVLGDNLVHLVRYIPNLDRSRHRIALVTPHLGPGGAESVLLDAAGALDRSRYQILLIATHSTDCRWADRWRCVVDHIYDLRAAVPARYTAAAIVSIVSNWQCETLLIQNSLAGYEVIADLKTLRPDLRIFDLVHAVSEDWNVVTCTAPVADLIDVRVAISQQAHNRLLAAGVRPERIRRIPNGVDLARFAVHPEPPGCRKILFAGRLDPVKRPKLLADIARAMRDVDGVRFVVAGDGLEEPALRRAARHAGVLDRFEFLGFVPDMAPVFAAASVVIIPSSEEGVPLVLLEALASARPVIASDVGAIREMLDEKTGVLIRRSRNEAEEFAGALRELLADPVRRAKMGRSGRRKAELMQDKQTMLQAYGELFEASSAEGSQPAEATRSLPAVR